MRHGKKINHLSRTAAHRKALMKNMSCALIQYKRINTTLAKAKALRRHLEPLVTKAKDNTTHSRRVVFRYLQQKDAIKELFGPIRDKVGSRPGGYLRIIKTGYRQGDAAATAMIEFVDFNEVYSGKGEATGKKKKSRRGGGKKKSTTEKAAAVTAAATASQAKKKAQQQEEE